MRRLIGLLLVLLTGPILGQTSAVTAQITDQPDNTAWASLNGFNATYTITLVTSGGVPVPAGQAYRADTGVAVTNPAGGNLDATGTFTATVVSSSNIRPTGTQWQFRFCSATISPNCYVVTMPINASGTYSTQLSAGAVSPRINGGLGAFAYNDTEVATTPNNSYYNITTPTCRYYGGSWGNCGAGAGGGSVTSVSVTTANGVSGTVATPTSTPAISLTLGAINPSSTGATTPGPGAFTTLNSDASLDMNSFSGATLDVKWNACNTAAVALGGGTCDARSLGGSQTISASLKCGNTSSVPVSFILPPAGTWTVSTQASSSDYDIDYFPGCVIRGDYASTLGLKVTHTASNGTSLGVLGPGPGVSSGYVNISGFTVALNSTTSISGAAMVISGADNAVFHDMEVQHYSGTSTGITTNGTNGNGICCGATLRNITVDAEYTGGTNLDLEGSSTLNMYGLILDDLSLVHAASGYPQFKCSSTGASNTSADFHSLHEETNNSHNTYELNYINGCTNILFDGLTPNDTAGSSTTTIVTTTNAANTGLVITNFNPIDFNNGAVIVNNGYTGVSTILSATCCGTYSTNPFLGVATGASLGLTGNIASSAGSAGMYGNWTQTTPCLGVQTGLDSSNGDAGIRWCNSSSTINNDIRIDASTTQQLWYSNSALLMYLTYSNGNLNGSVSGATLTWPNVVASTLDSAPGFRATGSTFSVAGCGTATSLVGGATAGKFVAAQASCTPVITTGLTAANGYTCWMNDETTTSVKFQETAYSQTTATFTATGTLGSTDTINFGCLEF